MLARPDQHPSSRKIILSLVTLLLVTQISILGVITYSITKVNEEATFTTESYVASVIEDKLKQLATLTKDYAYWDDTIENAYLKQDPEWIEENIGEYLTDTFKITDLLIINGQDEVVLSLEYGQFEKANYPGFEKDSLTTLIGKARLSGTEPVPVSGALMINKIPALVGVSILAPEDDTSLPSPRPVLLFAKRLDSDYLKTISTQYRLNDLQFNTEIQDSAANASSNIINPQNKILGTLSWQAEKPGSLVLSKILTPLILLLIISIFITLFVINASRAITHKLKKAHDDLSHLANHDFLTGLANRRLFNELLDQTIHTAKRDNTSCAMIYLDLDDFKKVNDTFGHQAGDQVLITVTNRLKEIVRESDNIARIGGDEFIVLLRNTSSHDDIEATVQKILTKLAQPIQIPGNEVQISASVGIAVIPADGIEAETLIRKTDMALYESKKLGRNTYKFYSELN